MDLKKLFSFNGRIGRAAFWGLTIAGAIVKGAGFAMLEYTESNPAEASPVVGLLGLVVVLLGAAVIVATEVKRWHDRGKSGFWFFIFLIPLIGPLWGFIDLCLLAGTEGNNRYGAPGSGSPFGAGPRNGRTPRSLG